MRNLRFVTAPLLALLLCLGPVPTASADSVRDFFVAVQIDNARTVKSLLAGAVDPNARDPRSAEPALVIALREDSMNVFKALLLDPRVQLELEAPNGNTALMMAAFKRNKPAVEALLDKGAAVNRPGWSPLHYAVAGGADDIVRLFLARGAALDARAPSDLTPLMVAAREGQESSVQLLLEAGADPLLKNGEGLTAAQLADRADKPRIVAAITSHLNNRASTR